MSRGFRAELLKLTTVRTPLGLAVGAVLLVAIAVVAAVGTGAVDHPQGDGRLVQATGTASLLALILGVLVVTTEYRHGTITQTFLATPVRERVVAAKLLAATAAGLALGIVASAVALVIALPWSSARGYDLGLDGESAIRFLRLLGVYAFSGALGVGIGALVRNQVGAIVGSFAWFLMVEPLLTLLGIVLTEGDDDLGPVGRYLPGTAFDSLGGGDFDGAQLALLSPPAALGLVLTYVALAAAAGGAALVRRDPK